MDNLLKYFLWTLVVILTAFLDLSCSQNPNTTTVQTVESTVSPDVSLGVSSTPDRDCGSTTPCYYSGEDLIKIEGRVNFANFADQSLWSVDQPVSIHRILFSEGYDKTSQDATVTSFCTFYLRDCATTPQTASDCWCDSSNNNVFTFKGSKTADIQWSQDGLFFFWRGRNVLVTSSITELPQIVNNINEDCPHSWCRCHKAPCIIIIVFGALAGLGATGAAVFYWIKKYKENKKPTPVDPPKQETELMEKEKDNANQHKSSKVQQYPGYAHIDETGANADKKTESKEEGKDNGNQHKSSEVHSESGNGRTDETGANADNEPGKRNNLPRLYPEPPPDYNNSFNDGYKDITGGGRPLPPIDKWKSYSPPTSLSDVSVNRRQSVGIGGASIDITLQGPKN